jgi:hypothetical protein
MEEGSQVECCLIFSVDSTDKSSTVLSFEAQFTFLAQRNLIRLIDGG